MKTKMMIPKYTLHVQVEEQGEKQEVENYALDCDYKCLKKF